MGPILFLILIKDIDKEVSSKVSLFADDTRVMGPVSKEEDVENLQKDLDIIYQWQSENNMLFNGKKFEMLRYGKNNDLKTNTNYFSPEYQDLIEVKDNLRDLGVIMSDNASFKDHINKVCKSVKQKCGWVLRTFENRETHFMKCMWKTLIQGHIDYCSQLYMPNQASEMLLLENLQKCYTKKDPRIKKSCLLAKVETTKIVFTPGRSLRSWCLTVGWKYTRVTEEVDRWPSLP